MLQNTCKICSCNNKSVKVYIKSLFWKLQDSVTCFLCRKTRCLRIEITCKWQVIKLISPPISWFRYWVVVQLTNLRQQECTFNFLLTKESTDILIEHLLLACTESSVRNRMMNETDRFLPPKRLLFFFFLAAETLKTINYSSNKFLKGEVYHNMVMYNGVQIWTGESAKVFLRKWDLS